VAVTSGVTVTLTAEDGTSITVVWDQSTFSNGEGVPLTIREVMDSLVAGALVGAGVHLHLNSNTCILNP
jgi:hypothetical protein